MMYSQRAASNTLDILYIIYHPYPSIGILPVRHMYSICVGVSHTPMFIHTEFYVPVI